VVRETGSFREFFEGIGLGLQSSSSQRTIIIIIVLGLVAISLIFWLVQRHISKEKARQKADIAFNESLRNVSMTKAERIILDQMTETMPNGRERKYQLVQDVMVFTMAAGKLMNNGIVQPDEIRKLRTKLDATSFTREKQFITTKELPEGLHFYITKSSPEGYHGLLVKRRMDYFIVRLKEDAEELEQSGVCSLFFKRRKDTYRINGVIKVRKGALAYFPHTEEIGKVQKRGLYRSEVSFPAVIRVEGYQVSQYQVKMVDLGGGGTRLESPGHGVHKGDLIKLLFQPDGTQTVEVPGEIVKISSKNDKEYLHVHFSTIKDKLRASIVSIALREGDKDFDDDDPEEQETEAETATEDTHTADTVSD